MNPPSSFRLTFPYGRTTTLAAGEELRVFLTPDVPDELWSSGDPTVLGITHRDKAHYLIGLHPGTASILIDGLPVGDPITVVDPARPQRLFIHMKLGHGQARANVVAGYDPSYPRDVTADPAVIWQTSSNLILALTPVDPGLLASHADGPARLWVGFHGLEAHVDLDCTGGVITRLGDIDADCRDYLVAGIAMPLSIQVDRSTDAGNRDTSCVAIHAYPPDAVRVERIASEWHVTGLRPGHVTLEAVIGTQKTTRQFEIRSLPIEISGLSIDGGYDHAGVRHIFQDESPYVSVRLSAPGYSYIPTKTNIAWSSSDESIARIDATGSTPQLICEALGTATIRAECAGAVAEIEVAVTERPEIQWF